jgi:hypothetical protein
LRIISIGLAISLAGCGTILDPSPHNPKRDTAVLGSVSPALHGHLDSHLRGRQRRVDQAASAFRRYADQRENIMREQLLFDVPMIGLAAAAVVNPLFNGAKNTALALGLGAAAAGGGRLYFGP